MNGSIEDNDLDEVGNRSRNFRSQPNRGMSFVRFTNLTRRKVEVIWINYEGARVRYKTLEPQEFFDVNTYVAHPWIFQDAQTHEYLLVNSKQIFEPGPWYQDYLPDLRSGRLRPQEIQPRRVTVNITSPLYSLKNCALNVISRCVVSAENINQLELPRQLQQELIRVKNSRN